MINPFEVLFVKVRRILEKAEHGRECCSQCLVCILSSMALLWIWAQAALTTTVAATLATH